MIEQLRKGIPVRALLTFVLSGMLLAGCASSIPDIIRNAPSGNPGVGEVRTDPSLLIGARVRWGGTIVAVENRASESWIEIVARHLERDGRPQESGASEGRFLARIDGFVDPVVYAKGRRLTVVGALEEPVTRSIGDFSYAFPVVHSESHFLWEPLSPPPSVIHGPFWYDPFFYDPWYPYYRHPFYRPYWQPPTRR